MDRVSALGHKVFFSIEMHCFQFLTTMLDFICMFLHWAGLFNGIPFGWFRLSELMYLINMTFKYLFRNPFDLPLFRQSPHYVVEVCEGGLAQVCGGGGGGGGLAQVCVWRGVWHRCVCGGGVGTGVWGGGGWHRCVCGGGFGTGVCVGVGGVGTGVCVGGGVGTGVWGGGWHRCVCGGGGGWHRGVWGGGGWHRCVWGGGLAQVCVWGGVWHRCVCGGGGWHRCVWGGGGVGTGVCVWGGGLAQVCVWGGGVGTGVCVWGWGLAQVCRGGLAQVWGGGWHKALVVGSVSLWRRLLASRL